MAEGRRNCCCEDPENMVLWANSERMSCAWTPGNEVERGGSMKVACLALQPNSARVAQYSTFGLDRLQWLVGGQEMWCIVFVSRKEK